MRTTKLATLFLLLQLLFGCKSNDKPSIEIVSSLSKNEKAVILIGSQKVVITADSCKYDKVLNEYFYEEKLYLEKSSSPTLKFSVSINGGQNQIDTTIIADHKILLIGILSPKNKPVERVYFHTEKTMITY